ncbi:MAG: hypothetical protein ACSHX6_13165 [Akkermansiaceae bacterium]
MMKLLPVAVGFLLPFSQAYAQGSSCIHNGSGNDLLRLNLHTTSIIGASSDRNFNHALHHHDPAEELDLQALEFSLFSNLSTHTQLYSTYTLSEDRGKFFGELEEAYIKLHRLPYGFEAKSGRFIHDLGLQGNLHVHDWDFSNSDLSTALFLGEEGVLTDGGELSWYYIYENYGVVGLTFAHGDVIEPGEGAEFIDTVTSARATVHHYVNDFNQHFIGLTAAQGTNGFGRKSRVIGMDYTYSWSDAGSEFWNANVDTSFQIMQRNIEWQDGATRGDDEQLAIIASSIYHFAQSWKLSCRAEWVEGVRSSSSYEEDERLRLSTALTKSFRILEDEDAKIRLQYNYDEQDNSQDNDHSHSLWLQFNFSFGKGWDIPD